MKRLCFIIFSSYLIFSCTKVLAQNGQTYEVGHHTGRNTFENSNHINIFDPLFYTEFLTDHNANRMSAVEQRWHHLQRDNTPYRSQGYNIQSYTQEIDKLLQSQVNNAGYKMQENTLQSKASEIKLKHAKNGPDSNSSNQTEEAAIVVDSQSNATSGNHHHHGPNGELIIHDRHHNVISSENYTNVSETVDQHSNMNHVSDSVISKSGGHDNKNSWEKKQTQNNKIDHHYLRYIIDQAFRPVNSYNQNRGKTENYDFLKYIVDQAARPVNSHYQDRRNGENYNFLRYIVDVASRPVNSVYQNRENDFLNLIQYLELFSGYDALDGIQDYMWLL